MRTPTTDREQVQAEVAAAWWRIAAYGLGGAAAIALVGVGVGAWLWGC